jgi:hypothetical protein
MAWAVDQLSIGNSGSASNAAFTTTATVAAGSWVLIGCGHFGAAAITSCSDAGPGLSYTLVGTATNGSVRAGLFAAYAPAGMASGTVITFVGFTGNQWICGSAFSGGGSGSTAGTAGTATGSTAAHAVSATTPGDNALEVQVLHVNSAATANTPDANSIETQDFSAGGSAQRGVMQYRIAGVAGSFTLGGTCGAATWATLAVGFTDASSAAATGATFIPHRMPLGA